MNQLYIACITTILYTLFKILDTIYIAKTKPKPSIIIKNGGFVFGSVYLAIYCLQLLVKYKIIHAGKLPIPAFIGSPEF
jgi:uncharacterized membrane protein YobD (UPF0266 family)|tara:strand:- start:1117 stop:1353 length:237 start_codon:yes stop_codon:yes gene_type:complete